MGLAALYMIACAALQYGEEQAAGEQEAKNSIAPVFPETNRNLVFVEGEDAISTNFDKEPGFDFGCSGTRFLRLNQAKESPGGTGYYADYAFYVDAPGTFGFWYGGTPPGPKDTLSPSYASPFEYEVDGSGQAARVYGEGVAVTGNYAASAYWSSFGELRLEKGMHTIRFTIKEKRRLDARYYFSLDCFFLVRKESGKPVPGKPLPDTFPASLDEKKRISPFPTIDDCLVAIRDNPEDVEPLIDIARVYTLAGDNLAAVKYLKRAYAMDSENEDVLYLLARNDVWRNEIDEGLAAYDELLGLDASRIDLWLEAGKVAAINGRFDDSADIFTRGLDEHPGDADLLANLGIAYLGAGMRAEADAALETASAAAGKDSGGLKRLAQTFIANGYPDRAVESYGSAINSNPEDLDAYLLLAALYKSMNMAVKTEEVRKKVNDTFVKSERLDAYVSLFFEKLGLREKAVETYERKLAAKPNDLALRETLAQAYFRSGRKKEAIMESLNILAYYLYSELSRTDRSALDYLEGLDRSSVCTLFLSGARVELEKRRSELGLRIAAYNAALKSADEYRARKAKAASEGKVFEEPGINPADTLGDETARLAVAVASVEALAGKIDLVTVSVSGTEAAAKAISEKNSAEQKAFEKRIEGRKWTWNERQYVAELSGVAGKGFALVYNVLARISLADDAKRPALASILLARERAGSPEIDFTLYEAYMRSGETEKALALFDGAGKDTIRAYAPYTEALSSMAGSLFADDRPPGGTAVAVDPKKKADEAMSRISDAVKNLDALAKRSSESYSILLSAYRQKMTRAFLAYEESTYLIRGELGDFFGREDALAAIAQYERALAIDPWDAGTLYKTGKAYADAGLWQTAKEYFRRVFWADPSYENASSLYNEIAREHADSIDVSASYLADTASVTWNVDAKYSIELNESIGIEASYEGTNKRIFRWEKLPDGLEDYAYTVHSLSLGLPLTFMAGGFTISPAIGFDITLNDNLYAEESATVPFGQFGDKNVPPSAFFELFNILYPEARLDFSAVPSSGMNLSGSAFFGLQPETLGFLKNDVYELGGTLNVGMSLAGTDLPVIENASARLYGEGEYIFDSYTSAGYNVIYAALGELSYAIIRSEEPSFTLSLFGNAYYQDSTIPKDIAEYDKIDYYSPQDVFLAGGGLLMTSYLALPDGNVLGIGLSGSVSYATQYELYPTPGSQQRLKLQLDASLEYTRGNGTIYVKPEFVMTPNLVKTDGIWDYWNFYVAVGYVASLPALLAE